MTQDSATSDMVSVIDETLDEATTETCSWCGRRITSLSASLYFCGEWCQELWHTQRVARRGSVQSDLDGVRVVSWEQIAALAQPLTVPRPWGDGESAEALGSPWVDPAVRRRWIDQAARVFDIPVEAIDPGTRFGMATTIVSGENMRRIADLLTPGMQRATQALAELVTQLGPEKLNALGAPPEFVAQLDVQHEGAGATPMQQAIRAKRHRNTGPERREPKDRHRKTRGWGGWSQL